MRPPYFCRIAAVVLAPFSAVAAAQSTWYVDAAGPGPGSGTLADPYLSIQAAIDAASTLDGDTIEVAAGTYAPIDFSGKAVAVEGASGVIIDGGSSATCVVVDDGEGAGTRIEGLTLMDGLGAAGPRPGGCVHVSGSKLEIVDCVIVGGQAAEGGGVAVVQGASLTVRGTVLEGNSAPSGAGLFCRDSNVDLVDTLFRANVAFGGTGGGLRQVGGALSAMDCTFESNRAFFGAGGDVDGVSTSFIGCSFSGGTDQLGCFQGGALRGRGDIVDCEFVGNAGQFGGALYGPFDVVGSTFTDNGFDQGESNFGGAFHGGSTADATATDCTFEDNFCRGEGGACHGVDLFGCVLRANRALEDPFNFTNGRGGALFGGSATDSTFEGNRAIDSGDPFLLDQGGAAYGATLLRCVLRGNRASEGAGAFACDIDRCTIVANEAAVAGGGAMGGSTVDSSIVRDNLPDEIAAVGPGPAVTYSDVLGGYAGTGNFDAPPDFFSLYGSDFRLLAGSPCIDAGNPAATDPDGSRADVGAFPFDPGYLGTPTTYCSGKVTSAGCVPFVVGLGNGSLSGTGFTCEARNVIGSTFGLVFWGHTGAIQPHLGGTLCLGGTLLRGPVQLASGLGACEGVLTQAFTPADLTLFGFGPGDRVYAQWFFRDPLQPDGTGLGLSDALEVVVVP